MNWDLLLEWMTHLGSGAWGAFRGAVAELANDEGDLDEQGLYRTLRIALSDLGHVDFFVGGSRRWHVLRPALVGLAGSSEHLLVGGRTRSLVDRLAAAAVASRADVNLAPIIPGLSGVQVVGDPDALRAVAEGVGVEYLPNAGALLSAGLRSIRSSMETAELALEPVNWLVRSWSFQQKRWVAAKLDRTVREYSNRYGVRRHFVHLGRAGLREVEKRSSFYCAALLRNARVVRYCHEDRSLHVPRWAPLPEGYARAACLAGGRLGTVRGDEIVFEKVNPCVASTLLVGLGQGFPMPEAQR